MSAAVGETGRNTAPPRGTLFLVPNALDFGSTVELASLTDHLPLGVIRLAARLTHWAAENARTTRAFLKRVDAVQPLAVSLQQIGIMELPRPPKGRATHIAPSAWAALLEPALAGHDMGLISEAGLPAVADPGASLVKAAHVAGVRVVPLPGSSAVTLAVAASGLNGQSFAFVGYVPVDARERSSHIAALESTSRRLQQTQVMIETPYRNQALLDALLGHLKPDTLLSVSCGLSLPQGFSRSDTVAGWRRHPSSLPGDLPAVFALLAG